MGKLGFLMNSILQQRLQWANRLGKSFGGKRDLYETLGYPKTISYDFYRAKYEREDLAKRIVDLPVIDTWRDMPGLFEIDGEEDPVEDTPFIQAFNDLAERIRLYHYFERADRLAGIGRYSVILMGFKGAGNLEAPLINVTGPDDLIYLSVYGEGYATVDSLVSNPADPRFGLPEYYLIDLGRNLNGNEMGKKKVHYSRIIHVADGLLEDDVYGTPRLQAVWNRLEDVAKTVGGSAEAAWKLAYKGLIVTNKEGYELPAPGSAEDTAMEEELQEYIHEFRRVLTLDGADVTDMGGEMVDPGGLFGVLVSLIAAAANIPQRILIGSERGELASSQDASTWAGLIESRRLNYAEPILVRAFIKRLSELGAWDEPERFELHWKPLFEMSKKEEAEAAQAAAGALQAAGIIVDEEAFLEAYLPALAGTGATRAELDNEDTMDETGDNAPDESNG